MASTLRRASMAAVAEAALGTSIWTTARAWPWGTRWERAGRAGSAARPRAKLAMLTPCSPRMVPMRPTTPGTSWLRMATRVPLSGASMSMPS